MGSTWLAVSANTGAILADLPLLDVPKVKQSIGRYETTTAKLPIGYDDAAPDWLTATLHGGAILVLLDDNPNDAAHGIPAWAGFVKGRKRNESNETDLELVSLEGYLDRRYVGDQTFTATGQNTIVQTLTNTYIKTGAKPGLPIRVQITAGGAGTLRDRTYLDVTDKTIYSVFQDLMGVIGGPEWYIGMEWQTAPERLTPVLYVGDRIGTAVTAGFAANAIFDMPGSVTEFELYEDFSVGRGANDVMAVSSGQGGTRPQSTHQVYTDANRPTFEYRFTPSTSITDMTTLNGHATVALAGMQQGARSLSLTAAIEGAPKLGVDWNLGDDVGFSIVAPAAPFGLYGTARAVGWERTLDNNPMITPILISTTGAFDVH